LARNLLSQGGPERLRLHHQPRPRVAPHERRDRGLVLRQLLRAGGCAGRIRSCGKLVGL